jgi:hypothetical protein
LAAGSNDRPGNFTQEIRDRLIEELSARLLLQHSLDDHADFRIGAIQQSQSLS